ncbi:hypothetical protein MycrhN_3812 [Mycolicibacterium rhodesiae NBB3]|uniref:Uncharacterized protein n=1 Tax=Mycolicibacterium rhodesiae (strain NBB3) TaxID=710685 RepID=G8RWM0_MYCRN|nr:hypothetical protein [Mycolicibacterium rhodesiae]AEV74328.1 hypothetical protein MycrhN_3812 [Mycolicibacterium rhodesiae NBB3]
MIVLRTYEDGNAPWVLEATDEELRELETLLATSGAPAPIDWRDMGWDRTRPLRKPSEYFVAEQLPRGG